MDRYWPYAMGTSDPFPGTKQYSDDAPTSSV